MTALCNANRRRKESVSRTVVGVCVLVCVSLAHVISHTSSDYRVTMCAQNKISIFAYSARVECVLLLGVCVWVRVCQCKCVRRNGPQLNTSFAFHC